MSDIILQAENVHKKFMIDKKSNIQLHVLKGICLKIFQGQIVAIVGASGAGKSTLLHILGGLDRPNIGEVYWGEKNIFKMNDDELSKLRTREVGFVFQFHHLLNEFTAIENVAIPKMITGVSLVEALKDAENIMKLVGLSERIHHKPNELSGGEQQRVAIARAMVNNPRIILADEPTGNLDSKTSDELFELIKTLNRDKGQTFIIATHNEKLAERSDRILKIVDGYITSET